MNYTNNLLHILKVISIATAVIVLLTGCVEEEITDTIPPGKVSITGVDATNGGAIISYELPDDDDILYVRAEYTNSLGKRVFKSSSRYVNKIEVDGFNDTNAHLVDVYVVDRANNFSEKVSTEVTPLISFIYKVQESITLRPDLGGIKISWENPAEKTVFVYLYYDDGSKVQERILSSNNAEEELIVRGMDSITYNFSAMVEDFNGNKTDQQFLASIKPLFEQKIDKSDWSLVQSLSVNGNAWEGESVNFFDDVVDTKESADDNSYFIINRDDNGGTLNFPLDLVIDLNKNIILNRFVVWQRAYWYTEGSNGISENYYYYQNENLRSFDLWASNDMQEWYLLGNFDIGDPRDEEGNIPGDKIQEAIDGHEFQLETTSAPFRYLKFSITSGYGSETNVYGSEITLFGLDNVQL